MNNPTQECSIHLVPMKVTQDGLSWFCPECCSLDEDPRDGEPSPPPEKDDDY